MQKSRPSRENLKKANGGGGRLKKRDSIKGGRGGEGCGQGGGGLAGNVGGDTGKKPSKQNGARKDFVLRGGGIGQGKRNVENSLTDKNSTGAEPGGWLTGNTNGGKSLKKKRR